MVSQPLEFALATGGREDIVKGGGGELQVEAALVQSADALRGRRFKCRLVVELGILAIRSFYIRILLMHVQILRFKRMIDNEVILLYATIRQVVVKILFLVPFVSLGRRRQAELNRSIRTNKQQPSSKTYLSTSEVDDLDCLPELLCNVVGSINHVSCYYHH